MKSKSARFCLALLALCFGLLFAWQSKAIQKAKHNSLAHAASLDELRDLVIEYQNRNGELEKQNKRLADDLEELQSNQQGGDTALKQLMANKQELEIFAGLVAVKGPGAVITLVDGRENKVDHSMLLTFVNQLRASNVQAIAINDQRLVAMSEIATTGNYPDYRIVVNGQIINDGSDKYRIQVIGDQNQLNATYHLLASYIQSLLLKEIGVHIDYYDELTLPALGKDSPAYRFGLLELASS